MRNKNTCTLRRPRSLKEAVKRLSRADGTSINQFVATAVAEKAWALQTARFFEDAKARADFKALDRINLCTRHVPEKLTPRGHHDWPDKRVFRQSELADRQFQ